MKTSDALFQALARLGQTRSLEPGQVVVHEGEPSDCLYLVHSGELRAVLAGDGGRSIELDTLRAGELFGELMLDGQRRSATVEVTARAQLTRVARPQVEEVLAARPDLAFELIQQLAHRVRHLTQTVRGLASVDVYGRLVGLFDALAVEHEGQRVVLGPLSQARIAERLGASRAMVHRLLHDLDSGGYISLSRERIVLLKKLPARW